MRTTNSVWLLLSAILIVFHQVHASCTCDYGHTCFPDKDTLVAAVNAFTAIPNAWTGSSGEATYGPIEQWCTGLITDMKNLFKDKASFNEDISQWNTENVVTMFSMFEGASSFNADISSWSLTSVTDMKHLFKDASSFNIDLPDWDTSSVKDMRRVFQSAHSFNGLLTNWDTSSVTNMKNLFRNATSFDQPISHFNTASVTDMSQMFFVATSFNGDISQWNTARVTNMRDMFNLASSFNPSTPLNWDVSAVTNVEHMFANAVLFNSDISGWNTESITYMRDMFRGAASFDQNVGGWNTAQVVDMQKVFQNAVAFNQDLSGWDLSSVENMDYMLRGATLFRQGVCSWRLDFPYDNAADIFEGTSCDDQYLVPDETTKENFCSECITEQPSGQPSAEPSSQPSSEPTTGAPSCVPSVSPTESPSTEFGGVALYYPRWEQNDEGCVIDGNEPAYMVVDPTRWLSTTLQACCKKWFSGYYYDQCLGRFPPSVGNCASSLYYPDWEGSNKGCLDDGKEPLYMLSNKDYFLSNSLLECCQKFYGWEFYSCTGTAPVLTNGEFYPDWDSSSSSDYCSNDGEIPSYMLNDQAYYLSFTLDECCEKHFGWAKNECLGITATGTNKWYISYYDNTCFQDCEGQKPCGGIAPSWLPEDQLYDGQDECCKQLTWVSKRTCILNSRSN